MKTLITGGAGFIGSKLSRELIKRGHEVSVVDNLSEQIHGTDTNQPPNDDIKFKKCDVRNVNEYLSYIDEADAIFHLASETGTGQSMYEISKYVSTNEQGTAELLQAISKCTKKKRKLILSSSRSVYGEGAYKSRTDGRLYQPKSRTLKELENHQWEILQSSSGIPISPLATPESLPFSPGSVYAATKASQELLVSSACPAINTNATIFRFQNVYGEGQSLMNPYTGIISIFFNRARQGLDILLYEDGIPSRDFVHVNDITRPLADSLEADLECGTVFNLGSGSPTSVKDLANSLCSAAKMCVPITTTGQFRLGDIRHCWADITKAKSELGFEPLVSLQEGLQRFTDWAKQEPTYADQTGHALDELKAKGLAQ